MNHTDRADDRRIGQRLQAAALLIGDVVAFDFADHVFDTAVVENVRDGRVTLTRPYALIGDAITTSGVSVTFGVEKIDVSVTALSPQFLLLRKTSAESTWKAINAEREALQAEIARLKDVVQGQRNDLEQRGRLIAISDTNLSQAKNSLDNVKEDLKRERARADLLDERYCAAQVKADRWDTVVEAIFQGAK